VLNLDTTLTGPCSASAAEEMVQAGRRLLGYAVARGYRDQPMLEILFNGPLFMEYCAFLIVGRRARRAHRGTSRLSSNMPASARQVEGITAADELGGLARLASLAVGHLPGEERARGTAWVARLARPPGALGGPLHAAGGAGAALADAGGVAPTLCRSVRFTPGPGWHASHACGRRAHRTGQQRLAARW